MFRSCHSLNTFPTIHILQPVFSFWKEGVRKKSSHYASANQNLEIYNKNYPSLNNWLLVQTDIYSFPYSCNVFLYSTTTNRFNWLNRERPVCQLTTLTWSYCLRFCELYILCCQLRLELVSLAGVISFFCFGCLLALIMFSTSKTLTGDKFCPLN